MSSDNRNNPAPGTRRLRVLAIKRSGHHAIIDWILDRCPEPSIHLDCCHDPAADPATDFLRANLRGYRIFGLKAYPPSWIRHGLSRRLVLVRSDPRLRLATLQQKIRHEARWVVASYENKMPPDRATAPVERPNPGLTFIVLRDPLNQAASLIRSGLAEELPPPVFASLYRRFADVLEKDDSYHLINYNTWTTDPTYRGDLCRRLGIRFDPSPHGRIPYQGGGSSFHSGIGDLLGSATLNRFAGLLDHPYLRSVLSEPGLAAIAERYFGLSFGQIRNKPASPD